ncbi:MAG: hypothetical protein WBM07_15345, partial [Chitinivibrionales bacterium]
PMFDDFFIARPFFSNAAEFFGQRSRQARSFGLLNIQQSDIAAEILSCRCWWPVCKRKPGRDAIIS